MEEVGQSWTVDDGDKAARQEEGGAHRGAVLPDVQ